MSFSTFGLHPSLLQGVTDLGFETPTPIQRDAIPPALEGRDLLACAMTGSGKTAAFALPILQRLQGKRRGVTRVLVLCPTRELAAQIHETFRGLGRHTPYRSGAVFGGVSMGPQQRLFEHGVDVLVATPGRLLDHLQYPYARLDDIDVLVLDEADRMLDMGFLPDIRRVLQRLPARERQTLLISATMPPAIAELARTIQVRPVMINVERQAAPATGVTQAVYPVAEELKAPLLVELLRQTQIRSALVFTRTKHRANRLAEWLDRHGVACDRIHGNRSQPQRTLALANFKDGKIQVLVATDIAARGIDIEDLSHVINLDVPAVPEDYIHRVGRTARAQAVGDAFTFVAPGEMGDLAAIERAIGRRLPRLTLAGFDYQKKPSEKLEIPIGERIAQIRARKAEERARAKEKAERRAAAQTGQEAARQGRGEAGKPAAARTPHPRPQHSMAGRGPQPASGAAPLGSDARARQQAAPRPAGEGNRRRRPRR